jgi:hypothetical protein
MASLSDYVLELFPKKPSRIERQAPSDAQFIQQTPAEGSAIPGTEQVTAPVSSMEPTPAPAQQQAAAAAFPFDDFAKKATMAQQARRELTSQINSIVMGAPKDMRDDLRKSLESEIDFIPKDTPSIDSFLSKNPLLKPITEKIQSASVGRSRSISDSKSIVDLIDYKLENAPKDEEKRKVYFADFARQLESQGKIYNASLSDNSDALSEGEAKRVLPTLESSVVDITNLLKSGKSVFPQIEAGVKKYKEQVQSVHDYMVNRSRSQFNSIAKQTSPEIAESLGLDINSIKPYNSSLAIPVISRQNPGGFSREQLLQDARRRGLIPK